MMHTGRQPVVTYTLIGLNVLIFLLQMMPGLDLTSSVLYAPLYSRAEFIPMGATYEPWRMLTSMFAHSTGSIFHILLNMYTLWIFGQVLESMLGRIRFLALYLIAGLAGSVAVMFWAEVTSAVVGASGAIFGLLGAFFIIQRKLGGDSTQLLILLGINLVMGFLPGLNISWQAHLGGVIAGVLVGLIYVNTRRPQQKRLQILLTSGLALVILALAVSHAPIFVT